MSAPARADGLPRAEDLPYDDGEPMENTWHKDQMNLLTECLMARWEDRRDFFTGGNMFIHYNPERAKNRDFRGPDFFVVRDVPYNHYRLSWVLWEENWRFPNFIVELISESTEREDRVVKRELYEQTFRTPEYFIYDDRTQRLDGLRLNAAGEYESIPPDRRGRVWSEQLECWFAAWDGPNYGPQVMTWLRMFEENGTLVQSFREKTKAEANAAKRRLKAQKTLMTAATAKADAAIAMADAATAQAAAEAVRANDAERELARLRAEIAAMKQPPPNA